MTPYYERGGVRVFLGDCRTVLAALPAESVHCVVTSPPYWGLRDYGVAGQLGLEPTPEEFVAHMVEVFREVRRVLRDDGTVFLNLGDSYASGWSCNRRNIVGAGSPTIDDRVNRLSGVLKDKDLVGIPWRVAFAVQADGWYLRSEITWCKKAPMPESVTDRPTSATEKIFLLTKAPRYFYDAEAVKEDGAQPDRQRLDRVGGANGHTVRHSEGGMMGTTAKRNLRNYWLLGPSPYPEAHFATFPPALVEPCILAGTSAKGVCGKCGAPWERVVARSTVAPASWHGSKFDDGKNLEVHPNVGKREDAKTDTAYPKGSTANRLALLRQQARENGGEYASANKTTGWRPTCEHGGDPVQATVLDPFHGAGTTGVVAQKHARHYIGIELNQAYIDLSIKRYGQAAMELAL